MPTLVLPPRDTEDAQAMHRAALAHGWRVERLARWRAPEGLRGGDLVLYGEPLFIDVITPALGLAVLEPTWDWTATLPAEHRAREVQFTTLGAARAHPAAAFVKPTEDKCFPARVYPSDAALAEATAALPDSTPVLLAEPVSWEIEFRCFVLDRRVVTFAPYLREGEALVGPDGAWPARVAESEEARRYATAFLADARVALPPAVVVDVGRIRGRGWAVVEGNGAWESGLYGCEPSRVLPVLARATRPRDALSPGDARWARRQYVVE
jgi:hypothetical protein